MSSGKFLIRWDWRRKKWDWARGLYDRLPRFSPSNGYQIRGSSKFAQHLNETIAEKTNEQT